MTVSPETSWMRSRHAASWGRFGQHHPVPHSHTLRPTTGLPNVLACHLGLPRPSCSREMAPGAAAGIFPCFRNLRHRLQTDEPTAGPWLRPGRLPQADFGSLQTPRLGFGCDAAAASAQFSLSYRSWPEIYDSPSAATSCGHLLRTCHLLEPGRRDSLNMASMPSV